MQRGYLCTLPTIPAGLRILCDPLPSLARRGDQDREARRIHQDDSRNMHGIPPGRGNRLVRPYLLDEDRR